tara:strand:+ start:539 stop:820 length:282 start_codon:yes stop_codon:yes gene_type:complete
MSKKIEIDAICNFISTDIKSYEILHIYEMMECIDILLTENQKDKFSADLTIDFIVGEKRFLKFVKYIDPHNVANIWRIDKKNNDYILKNKSKI